MRKPQSISYAVAILMALTSCGQHLPWDKREEQSAASSPPPVTTESTPGPAPIPADDVPNPAEQSGLNKATLTNLDSLLAATNARTWHSPGRSCQGLTIAIFDNGFEGLNDSKGIRLPPTLAVERAPVNDPLATPHGTKLAEVIWALCTGSPVYSPARPGPTLRLYNTNGFSNLSAAVNAVTSTQPADIVLYSQVWEFGGNFDGQGFINSLVNQVTSRGILWVNAAGNFAETSWQSMLRFDASGNAKLAYQDRYVRLTVTAPKTPVKLTLAWNDFTDAKTYRTKQNLDLFLENANHQEIASAKLIQDGVDHGTEQGYSAYAREQIVTVLEPGTYYVRVSSPSPIHFTNLSRLRLAGDGAGLVFQDQVKDASIMIPADNASVLTIGASDVSISSSGRVMTTWARKPEGTAPSILEFDNGQSFAGSSSAAAVATAMIALYENSCGKMGRAQWAEALTSGRFSLSPAVRGPSPMVLPPSGQCTQRPVRPSR